ncbi:MAG: hypothetical protein V3V00_12920 [Saprospiraceae bacterium]
MRKLLLEIFKIIIILVFPFILLLRGAVEFHDQFHMSPFTSILAGIGVTVILLFLYFTIFYTHFSGHLGTARGLKVRILAALLITISYATHGIFYISTGNLKNENVKSEINKVHPILRLSVSTIVILDSDFIITDGKRVPEDYRKMGLKAKAHSLHYKQKDGYSHALDLRTKGRSKVRNMLLRNYFRMMGFSTLRHVGTADHLHVSLKSHDRPYAK